MNDRAINSVLKNILDHITHQAQVNLETVKCITEIAKLLEAHSDNSKLLNQIESLLNANNALVENFSSGAVLTVNTIMNNADEKENGTEQ